MGLAKLLMTCIKVQVIEFKTVTLFLGDWTRKTRGEKMKDSLAMLLKTNVEKMSVIGSLAILMKTNQLYLVSRDVDEK
jgi:hypothetical protein